MTDGVETEEGEDTERGSVDETAELSERFSNNRQRQTSQANESTAASDASHTHQTSSASESNGADEPEHTAESVEAGDETDIPVRKRKQTAMYLAPEQRKAVEGLYEQLDARRKLAGEGKVSKHDDFFEAFVAVALDHETEIAERLNIELPEE